MRFFWQEKPRPLTYENRCGFHKSEWNGDTRCYLCSDEMDTLRIVYQPNKQEDALDKLLQSHAALEQKIEGLSFKIRFESLEQHLGSIGISVASTNSMVGAGNRSNTGYLDRLDALLKATGDALQVEIQQATNRGGKNIAQIHVMLEKLLRKRRGKK